MPLFLCPDLKGEWSVPSISTECHWNRVKELGREGRDARCCHYSMAFGGVPFWCTPYISITGWSPLTLAYRKKTQGQKRSVFSISYYCPEESWGGLGSQNKLQRTSLLAGLQPPSPSETQLHPVSSHWAWPSLTLVFLRQVPHCTPTNVIFICFIHYYGSFLKSCDKVCASALGLTTVRLVGVDNSISKTHEFLGFSI